MVLEAMKIGNECWQQTIITTISFFEATEMQKKNKTKRRVEPEVEDIKIIWSKFRPRESKILNPGLGTGQNLSGTRAGTIDRGAKTFFRKKLGGRRLFFEKN